MAGTNSGEISGNGMPSLRASLKTINDLRLDQFGNLFVANSGNVVELATNGLVYAIAGGYTNGPSLGDGGPLFKRLPWVC